MTKMKYTGCIIHTFFCLLIILMVSLVGCTPKTSQNHSLGTQQMLCGTYTSGGGDAQVFLSVDDENRVYYTDQKNDLFIQGSIQLQGEDTYLLSCEDPDKADIIPDQEFSFDGESLFLAIREYQYEFQKIDDTPTIIGDIYRYS